MIWWLLGAFGVRIYPWVMRFVCSISWGFSMVIQLMRTARVTWTISVIQVSKFIGFVCAIKAKKGFYYAK